MPNLNNVDWTRFLIQVIVVVLSISLHEFGHAISADKLGDPTPRRQGRITLWPDKHLDPIGFIMIVLTSLGMMGLGWGKPVLVNPNNFKHPRRDMVIVAACGPVMNLILAVVFGLVLRVMLMNAQDPEFLINKTIPGNFIYTIVWLNLVLLFFNLIPVHPLDGGKLLSGALPANQAASFDRFFYQFGPIIILLLVMSRSGVLDSVIGPPVNSLFRLITGY